MNDESKQSRYKKTTDLLTNYREYNNPEQVEADIDRLIRFLYLLSECEEENEK